MTNEKITEILDRCNGRLGWVQIHIDTAENYMLMPLRDLVELLEKQMHNCEDCKHANYYDWCTLGNHLVLCREHNAMMEDDNCCRDWTPLER